MTCPLRAALVLLATLLSGAGAAWANEVTGLRSSLEGGRLRMVMDLKEAPVYQVSTSEAPPQLRIDLFQTQGDPPPAPPTPTSSWLVRGWRTEQPNARRFRWTVDLRAPLPGDRHRSFLLEDPPRLVVDLQTSWESEERYPLTPGVSWIRRESVGGPRGYLLWNELAFKPGDPEVRLDLCLAEDRLDRRETVSSMAARTGALAGLNGGFFASQGGPLGLVVRDGKVLAPHVSRRPPRTVLGITRAGEIRFDQVASRAGRLSARGGQDWGDVALACGGGPRLLHRGQLALSTDEEELGPKGNDITRVAGRTAAALTADGRMLLVTASGHRDNHREGLKLDELARALLQRGAREAMNFDGGASVDMVVGGQIVSDGPANTSREKPVATAWLLFDARPPQQPARIEAGLVPPALPADGTSTARLRVRLSTPGGQPVPDGTPVWLLGEGVQLPASALTLGGRIELEVRAARAPGPARISIRSGAATASVTLNLEAGPPARLWAERRAGRPAPGGGAPAPAQLLAVLEDRWHNGLAGIPIQLTVGGGAPTSWLTGPQGEIRIPLPDEAARAPLELRVSPGSGGTATPALIPSEPGP